MSGQYKNVAFMIIVLLLHAACNRDSEMGGQKTSRAKPLAAAGVARMDTTVKYDDGKLTRQVQDANKGDKLGVWFSPPREIKACSLYAVQYFFGSIKDSATGFVDTVSLYNGIASLKNIGSELLSFDIDTTHQATVILPNPIPVKNGSDFFIGWNSGMVGSSTSPIGQCDMTADHHPPGVTGLGSFPDGICYSPYLVTWVCVQSSNAPLPPPIAVDSRLSCNGNSR